MRVGDQVFIAVTVTEESLDSYTVVVQASILEKGRQLGTLTDVGVVIETAKR